MKMAGNVLTMVERADDEFIKILQSTDAHSTDYVTKYNIYLLFCVCLHVLCSYVCIIICTMEGVHSNSFCVCVCTIVHAYIYLLSLHCYV